MLLAFRTPEERARLIAEHTEVSGESAVSKAAWTAAVKAVARDGYACAPSHLIRGVTNIGAPVRGRNGEVVAALVIPYLEGLGPERHSRAALGSRMPLEPTRKTCAAS